MGPVSWLVIGDPHFKPSNFPETNQLLKDLQVELTRRPVDFIVVLGDILDRHEQINVHPLTRAIKFLRALTDHAPTYVLIGNHDRPNNQDFLSDLSPFYGLHGTTNLIIVDRVNRAIINGHRFVFVPYVPPGKFHEALSTLDTESMPDNNSGLTPEYHRASIIFAHQEFRGAKSGIHESTIGDTWSLDEPVVITGHFHDYHQLTDNVLYVGTPFQHTFAESPDKSVSWFRMVDRPRTIADLEEIRVYPSIPARQTHRYSYDEFISLDPTVWQTTSRQRFLITATPTESSTLKSHPNYRTCAKAGHKIECRIVTGPRSIQLPTPQPTAASFDQRFRQRLQTDPEVSQLLTSLNLV